MKRQKIKDERVAAQQQKISSEAYRILMLVLAASIIIQQFILHAPFEQYAVEFIAFFGMAVYVTVRSMVKGINIYGEDQQTKYTQLVSVLVCATVVTVINGVLNYINYAENYREDGISLFIANLMITFISAALSAFVMLSLIRYLNRKRQERIQKQLDNSEQDI